jgi:hypothetical protein
MQKKLAKQNFSLRVVEFFRIIPKAGQTHSKIFKMLLPFHNFFSLLSVLILCKKACKKSYSLKLEKISPHQHKDRPHMQ